MRDKSEVESVPHLSKTQSSKTIKIALRTILSSDIIHVDTNDCHSIQVEVELLELTAKVVQLAQKEGISVKFNGLETQIRSGMRIKGFDSILG